MTKHHVGALILTFVFGLFSGVYLYLVGFATWFSGSQVIDVEESSLLTIIADAYGGCRNQCPSYQVLNDGSYRFIYYLDGQMVEKEGELSSKLQKQLGSVLSAPALRKQSLVTEPESCESYRDGMDVTYDITFKGQGYFLDSCGTSVDRNSALWLTLSDIWQYLQTD